MIMWSIITVIIIIFVIVRELKKSRSQRENNSSFSDVEKSDPKDSKEEKKYPKAPLYEELLQAENMELSGNIIIFDKEIKNTNSNYCKQLLNRYISEIESNNFLQRNPFDKLQVEIKNNNDQILQTLEFYGTPTARTRYFYDNSGILRLTYHSSQGETREITLYETLSNQNYRKLSLYRDSDEKNFRVYSVEEENQEKQKIFSYEYYDAGGGDYRLYQRKYNLDNSFIELTEGFDRWLYCYRDLTQYDSLGRKINVKSYENYTEKLSDDKLVSETDYFYDERGNEIEERTYFYETEKTEKHLKEFDEHNNLIHEILKDGAERIYKYDSNNNLTYEKNCFQETYYSYDKENRCVLRKTTKNGITRYHYNKDGTISIEYEDNDGNVTTEHRKSSRSFSGELNHTFKINDNKGEVAIKLYLKEFDPINLLVKPEKS